MLNHVCLVLYAKDCRGGKWVDKQELQPTDRDLLAGVLAFDMERHTPMINMAKYK